MKQNSQLNQLTIKKDKYKVFNNINLTESESYDPLDKNYKKIYIMQHPVIYDEPNIMNLHAMNVQEKILDRMDNKLFLYDQIRERKKKKVMSKMSNLVLSARDKIIGREDPSRNKIKKIDNLSNKQILNLFIDQTSKEGLSNFQGLKFDKIMHDHKLYEEVTNRNNINKSTKNISKLKINKNNINLNNSNKEIVDNFDTLSLISMNVEKENNKNKTPSRNYSSFKQRHLPSNFTSSITKLKNKNKNSDIIIIIDPLREEARKDENRTKKLNNLFKAVENIKPFKKKNFLPFFIKGSKFKRENVVLDELDIKQMNQGIKSRSLSMIKPLYKKNINNIEKRFGNDTKELNMLKNLNKIIRKNSKSYHKKSNSVISESAKFSEFKSKKKLAHDYEFIRGTQKESRVIQRKSGAFIYGENEGFSLINANTLYGSKYKF